jgi:glycosyltransferase involved in cell wall biosynthesis
MPEVGGDAALYADPQNPDELAKQMLKLYKDETLREEMIKKGLERANEFSWNRSTELLWDQILDAARN